MSLFMHGKIWMPEQSTEDCFYFVYIWQVYVECTNVPKHVLSLYTLGSDILSRFAMMWGNKNCLGVRPCYNSWSFLCCLVSFTSLSLESLFAVRLLSFCFTLHWVWDSRIWIIDLKTTKYFKISLLRTWTKMSPCKSLCNYRLGGCHFFGKGILCWCH